MNGLELIANQVALSKLNSQLSLEPDSVSLRTQRAQVLVNLNQLHDAKSAYIDILKLDQSNFTALMSLGAIYEEIGDQESAQSFYIDAVRLHPTKSKGHIALGFLLGEKGELEDAQRCYEFALKVDPGNAEAHRGLVYILTEREDIESLEKHKKLCFKNSDIIPLPYLGKQPPIEVLLLLSAGGGDTPVRNFLDNTIFKASVLFVDFYDLAVPLPDHHLIFNTITDADRSCGAMLLAKNITSLSSKFTINAPEKVLNTGRVDISKRLSQIPNVIAPKTFQVRREILLGSQGINCILEMGLCFPILLRRQGFHTGQFFVRVDSPEKLDSAVKEIGGNDILVIQFIDSRASDNLFRKYRVMLVGDKIYPLHLAISSDWKVHYFSADMATNAHFRKEEEEFLTDMPLTLGSKAMVALREIQRTLDLEYAGIDFTLSNAGELILFEANATMTIAQPDQSEHWNYRRDTFRRVLEGIAEMIRSRALMVAKAQ